MKFMGFTLGLIALCSTQLTGCGSTTPMQVGDSSAKTVATGSAGGENAQGANPQLEKCEKTLGTIALVEDQGADWYRILTTNYKLGPTSQVLKLLIQQSNCFVVVERGAAMRNVMGERALEQTGELRGNSNFGKGQMVSADYTLNPSITFSANDTGGMGANVASFIPGLSAVAAVAGSVKSREASTLLTLIDNRSGVQLAAAEGSAKKWDLGLFGGLFGGSAAGSMGGYTKTPEGKVLVAAFLDSYNQVVKAVKNYKAQTVEGGLGTGGALGVQGGSTPASQKVDQERRANRTRVAPTPPATPSNKTK
ncbi:CsgG/HfaB family protein [Parvibium lacunae]|uniref:Peptidoglycan-binding protein n=1 Tax=Parvibium lacunae TaxID=1888893 RepID=A0A368L094_9BURK|nr:CsgG/HfaB family protein [Parvibium lacunae]RCS56842.1 peptidoglycan-binding protein [Parvibium lacunae]